MPALQDQDLEHEHMLEGWASALRAVSPRHGPLQIRSEKIEVDQPLRPFEIIALRREFFQSFVNIEKASLTARHPAPKSAQQMESYSTLNHEVFGGVQLLREVRVA